MRRLKNAISEARGMMNSRSGVAERPAGSGSSGKSRTFSTLSIGSSIAGSSSVRSSRSVARPPLLVSDQIGDFAACSRDREGLGGMMSIFGKFVGDRSMLSRGKKGASSSDESASASSAKTG